MKRLQVLPLALIVVALVLVRAPAHVAADVNDFTVTNFVADYHLSNTDPQGEIRVVERINVNFTDSNHGILRALPQAYKNLPLNLHVSRITSETGAPTQYTTYVQNGNEVLKIGDPNRTVTGAQQYTIDYTMQNVVTFYGDHDELYWNTNGVQWAQPFEHISATLHLSQGLRLSTNDPLCYAGPEGSRAQACTIAHTGDTVAVQTTAELGSYQTLSFVVGFAKGYFQPPTAWDYVRGYMVPIIQFLAPMLVIGGAGFVWWWKRGRDAKGTGIIIPQYDAPGGLSPLEVGTLVDFKPDNRDVTATIIDLAIRKYLRIVEQDKQVLLNKSKQFSLEILNNDLSGLNQWESQLMGALISEADNGSVSLAKPLQSLRIAVNAIKKSVDASLASSGYFVSSPYRFMAFPLVGILVAVWFIAPSGIGAVVSGFLMAGITAGSMIFAVFYHFMPARTAKGVAAYEHALGLKLYLNVAEKDRLKMLQSPDAPYMPKSEAPTQTVELFEKLLPFAIVFKVEKQWAAKFEGLYQTPPEWYSGSYGAFSVGYLAGSIGGTFGSAVAGSFSTPRSASGSGFGGGFSGGGGGGGGGGW